MTVSNGTANKILATCRKIPYLTALKHEKSSNKTRIIGYSRLQRITQLWL